MKGIRIGPLSPGARIVTMLSDMIVETVAGGGSVSFMHPFPLEQAKAFWDKSLAATEQDARVVLGAWDGAQIVGTVTIILDLPPNQPHRVDIAKLMVRVSHRNRGIAAALMRAAEAEVIRRGRWLLVLDTATEGGASRLYASLGFTLAGIIPDYALLPHGGLTGTMLYWKRADQKEAIHTTRYPELIEE